MMSTKFLPLSIEDKVLIAACKDERDKITRKIRELRAGDMKANFARIKKLQRERNELTDRVLAEKFETTRSRVESC